MAETKRYYWLKLKEGFFGEREVKKLRKIAGGDTYTIIYLKLMLLSLRETGKLYFYGVEETFHEELALELDEDPENVRVTILYLLKTGLMEEINDSEAFLTRIPECVGSETVKAEQMRRSRDKKKSVENGNNVTALLPTVTKCYTEKRDKRIELEIEIEKKESISESEEPIQIPAPSKPQKPVKHKYGEYLHVMLTDEELGKLKTEYGTFIAEEAITFLDEYIEMKGYKAKSHYLAIRKWVVGAVKERKQKKPSGNPANSGRLDWMDNVTM